jgi:hypothetical protein
MSITADRFAELHPDRAPHRAGPVRGRHWRPRRGQHWHPQHLR